MRVGLFITCLADLLRPSLARAARTLLALTGAEVVVPRRQTCCGQPALNAGAPAAARALALKLVREFADCDAVVLPSGSCAGTLRIHYPGLFTERPEAERRDIEALAARTHELAEFLERRLPEVPGRYAGRVTYHDSCSGLRELGVKQAPRALLARVPGLTLVEMATAEDCCGFGGTFALKYGAISAAICDRKCAAIRASGAGTVTGGDLGCLMHMAGRLQRTGDTTTRVLHWAEIVAGTDGVRTWK